MFFCCFHYEFEGDVLKEWFGKTVIYSDHRFAYEEAQELIETEKNIISKDVSLTGKAYTVDSETLFAVLKLNRIAKNFD